MYQPFFCCYVEPTIALSITALFCNLKYLLMSKSINTGVITMNVPVVYRSVEEILTVLNDEQVSTSIYPC